MDRVSDFVGQYFSLLVLGVGIMAVAWGIYSQNRRLQLAAKGQCARCRADNASIPLPNDGGLLCEPCGEVAWQRDQIGLFLMRGLVGLFTVALIFGVARSISLGKGIPWDFVAPIVTWGIIVPLLLIQRVRMPPRSHE